VNIERVACFVGSACDGRSSHLSPTAISGGDDWRKGGGGGILGMLSHDEHLDRAFMTLREFHLLSSLKATSREKKGGVGFMDFLSLVEQIFTGLRQFVNSSPLDASQSGQSTETQQTNHFFSKQNNDMI